MQPTLGRVVHYVMNTSRARGQERPAIIVRVWGEDQVAAGQLPPDSLGTVQLQVFTDELNDGMAGQPVLWRTSVPHDEAKSEGSWHWPERVQ